MDKKFFSCPFEVKSFDDDDEFFNFQGYASTFGNVDLGGDIIEKGAFQASLEKRMPSLLFQHNMNEPIGVFDLAVEDERGLFVKGRMPKADSLVSGRVIPQMRIGSIKSMSIGFSIIDVDTNGDGNRLIKGVDLFEASLVTIPMNPKAQVTDFKAATPFKDLPLASRERAWNSDAAVRRIREFTDSVEAPSSRYKDAFLWYDRTAGDDFGSYKLPFADVIDDKLVAIPRAIFAIGAILQGARGGVDLPEADINAVKRNVDRYRDKMGLDSLFERRSIYGIENVEYISTKKEFEHLLRDSGAFSKSARVFLASRFVESGRGEPEQISQSKELLDGTIAEFKKFIEVNYE